MGDGARELDPLVIHRSAPARGVERWSTPAAAALAMMGMLLHASVANAQLTLRLDTVPLNTPAESTIYVAGSFNSWQPRDDAYALERTPHGYTITLPASVRGSIEFKFTLGSWETVETTRSGEDIPNRTYTVPHEGSVTVTTSVAGWRARDAERPPTRTASVHILSDTFPIAALGRVRRIWLYLPPDYTTSAKRYPVLYMHDGQNVFDAATSFSGEWGVDETLDELHRHGDYGLIVVAVDHGGDRRLHEYNPWVHEDERLGGGEGDAYLDFLVHTLKPYIDAHYRTRADPQHTGIMGSSMGGLISLYAALRHPDVFGRAGVFSCACWIARPHIYSFARRARPPTPLPRIYFISGAQETADGGPARDQREVVDSLAAAGFPPERAVRSHVVPDGKHAEWFWRREFARAYQWLFGHTIPRKDRRSR